MRTVGLVAALLAVATLLGGLGFSKVSAGGTAIAVSSVHAKVGTISKVDVRALAMPEPGLAAWTVDVHYDPDLLTVLGCEPVNGLCNAEFNDTTVRVAGTNINGLPGDTNLASIAVACKAGGEGSLELSTNVLADATIGDPQPIDAALEHGTVVCKTHDEPQPTDEPKPTATPPGSEPKLPGDADCNGTVNSIDAAIILQYTAGLISSPGCPDDADNNHDGEIDSIDAALVLQKDAGLF